MFINTLKKSIAAGVLITIGAAVKLMCDNAVTGSVLFSIGLFFICYLNMFLYTGKIGFIDKTNAAECALTWVGNLTGCIFAMGLIRIARPELKNTVENMMINKTEKNMLSMAVLSFFCGIIMYLAVKNYRCSESHVSKTVGIILGVTVFLLCGFEHSIANMAYSVLYIDSVNDFLMCLKLVAVSTVFNSVGSLFMRLMLSAGDKYKQTKNATV